MSTRYTLDGRVIFTCYDRKAIPARGFDWRAALADYEPGAPMGWGPTEQAAIDDLLIEIAERDA